MLDFSDEALQVVSDYIKKFRRALGKLQLEPDPLYAQILSFEFEDLIKFRCLKYSSKRGAKKIEAFDVNNVLKKLGRPTARARRPTQIEQDCLNLTKRPLLQQDFLSSLFLWKSF